MQLQLYRKNSVCILFFWSSVVVEGVSRAQGINVLRLNEYSSHPWTTINRSNYDLKKKKKKMVGRVSECMQWMMVHIVKCSPLFFRLYASIRNGCRWIVRGTLNKDSYFENSGDYFFFWIVVWGGGTTQAFFFFFFVLSYLKHSYPSGTW